MTVFFCMVFLWPERSISTVLARCLFGSLNPACMAIGSNSGRVDDIKLICELTGGRDENRRCTDLTSTQIPLMLPRLPLADSLLPYLRRIDANRHYSNAGPLLAEFESRLAAHFAVDPANLVCVANATAGLILSLIAIRGSDAARCIIPSWTFEASAAAVVAAGMTPWFHDVREETWALDPDTALRTATNDNASVSAVMPVCPFGAPVQTSAWDELTRKSGVPVVIDAAAAFEGLVPGRAPSVVSFHATKLLSTGEGGAVISTDADLIAKIRHLANFGFEPVRRIKHPGFNAKLSEYAAAVGLAALDTWPERRREIAERSSWYHEFLSDPTHLTFAPGFCNPGRQPTCNIRLLQPLADPLIDWLSARGIAARKWWGSGCHRQPAFASSPRTALPVTEVLADSVVGLPFFADISRPQVQQVAAAVSDFMQQNSRPA